MSAQQTSGDLTSPSTYLNNTATGLFAGQSPVPQHLQQHQHFNSSMQHQQMGDSSSLMPPSSGGAAAAAADYGQGDMGGMGDSLHEHGAMHPGAEPLGSHPLMLTTADSLLSQGSTDLCGLGESFDVEGVQQQHHHQHGAHGSSFGTAAAATRVSIDMQDALNMQHPAGGHAGSPQLQAGSHSPGLSHFGGSGHTAAGSGGHDSYTADSMKMQQQQQQQQNGTHYGALVPQEHLQHHQQHQQQQQQHAAAAPQQQQRQSQSQRQSAAQQRQGGSARASSSVAAAAAAAGGDAPAQPVFRSQYRGVSYDKKKRKWRVQIKVAALGKSGVSVGYFDTEDAAARAYDRAAIGLLGRQNCKAVLNFPIEEYDNDSVPELVGKSREEVKATLKSERAKLPRRRLTHRRRTSRFLGVGSSNRKNQWQARILYHGKVTHLGYYRTEEEAARVYDKVSISLHGAGAQTNFPIDQYKHEVGSLQQKLSGLTREELQRALGVKPMDKSSRFRGVSKKKGRWEAKVMLNRKWAYRELFDTETEAARAYDTALWRLKPREARNYANFKDTCPPDVAELLATLEKDTPLVLHPTGLPLTAKPLIDAGLLYDDEGQSIRAPNGLTRSVSIGDLISPGESAGQSVSEEPSAGNGSAGRHPLSGDGASGGAAGAVAAVAGAAGGISSLAGPSAAAAAAAGLGGPGGMVKSASYSALSGLDGAVTSSLAAGPAIDPAAAAAVPVPLSSLPASARSALRGELTHMHLPGDAYGQQQQHHQHHMGGGFGGGLGGSSGRGLGGMTRVQSVPQLRTYGSDGESPTLPPMPGGGAGHAGMMGGGSGSIPGLPSFGSGGYGAGQYEQQQQWMPPPHQQHQQQMAGYAPQQQQQQQQQQQHQMHGSSMALKAESAYWTPELSYPLPDHHGYQQQQPQQHHGMRASRSCGNLAFMASSGSGMVSMGGPGQGMGGHGVHSPPGAGQPFGGNLPSGPSDFAGESKPLMVRVGSEQHLLNPNPNPPGGFKGMSRIASESQLSSMVPLSPQQFMGGPDRGLIDGPGGGYGHSGGSGYQQQGQGGPSYSGHGGSYGHPSPFGGMPGGQYGGMPGPQHMQHPGPGHQQQQHMYQQQGSYALSSSPSGGGYMQHPQQQPGMQQLQPGSMHLDGPGMPPLSPVRQQQQQQQQQAAAAAGSNAAAAGGRAGPVRSSSMGGMHRAHSCAALESIDETSVFRLQQMRPEGDAAGHLAARGHSLPGTLGALPPAYAPGGAPVSASGAYLAQQQGQPPQQQMPPASQQQPGGMVPTGGGYGSGGGLPPVSTALPVPPDLRQQHQYGQPGAPGGFGGPSASSMHMGQAGGAAAPGSSGAMYGMGGSMAPPGGAGAASSAAAAAAAFDVMAGGADKWDVMGQGAAPESPLGNVQIGGEDLDVTMAFLTDHSPRHLGEHDDGLDITGLLTDPCGAGSPGMGNSGLLFGEANAAPAGDAAIKMDE